MANSDAAHLEVLKTIRDAMSIALVDGRSVVRYTIRGREVESEASTEALERLELQIDTYERKAARGSRSPFRLASLSNPRRAS